MRSARVKTIARGVFAGALFASIAAAQSGRRAADGAWAIRVSAGLSVPVGSEQLAVGWSAGPAITASLERYLTDRQTTGEFSFGALVARSVHPFDESGFVANARPNGAIPISAASSSASMTTVAGVARVITRRRLVSPFLSLTLGFFQSQHGVVAYASAAGSGVSAKESKNGFLFGLGLGGDAAFGALALTFEGGIAIGASNKDVPEGTGQLMCDSGGCGVPKKRTEIASLKTGVRWALPRHSL